jgi:hypothetical protein
VDDIKFQYPRGNMTNEKGCLDVLIKSYETCMKHHTFCNRNNVENWIPTRLLDVHESSNAGKVPGMPSQGWS